MKFRASDRRSAWESLEHPRARTGTRHDLVCQRLEIEPGIGTEHLDSRHLAQALECIDHDRIGSVSPKIEQEVVLPKPFLRWPALNLGELDLLFRKRGQ